MKPLNVYTLIPPNHSASAYYRLQVPLETAQHLGLPLKTIVDRDSASVSPQDRFNVLCESDLTILYQPVGEAAIRNIRALQNFIPSKRDGEWRWPPTVVIETDDNLFNVSPLNQAFKSLGIRDMNGELIPLGHEIGVMRAGEKQVLWKDGENNFSLARNRQTVESYRTLLEMVDGVSCSTPNVQQAVEKETACRRIGTFPNLVRFDHYEQVDLARHDKKIRILWQGGIAHYEDWFPLREALGNITKRYPEVEWIVWGAQFPWVKELIPPDRYSFKAWCPYQEYKLRLAMIGHDISLAPLTDNVFNCCRSAIKWYEASVLKRPAATLAQNTGPYAREIQDGETALLFNGPAEFEQKLSLLIEDAKLRQTLASNAKQWISEHRDAMKEVPKLVDWWQRMRADRPREQPHVSDSQWQRIEEEAMAEEEVPV